MSALRIISFIAAAILIFFGVLFIWATFTPDGSTGWLIIGVVSVAIGFGLIWLGTRFKTAKAGRPKRDAAGRSARQCQPG